jgi:hypothetical protein
MGKYLLLYTGGGQPASEEEGQAVIKAWTAWFMQLGPAIVDPGNPIGPNAKTLTSDGGASDGAPGEPASGYSVIKADSFDEAVDLARTCPHLQAGGTVTVYETLEVM